MGTTPHEHLAEPSQVEVTKVIVKINLKSAHSSVNPSQISAQEVSEIYIYRMNLCFLRVGTYLRYYVPTTLYLPTNFVQL